MRWAAGLVMLALLLAACTGGQPEALPDASADTPDRTEPPDPSDPPDIDDGRVQTPLSSTEDTSATLGQVTVDVPASAVNTDGMLTLERQTPASAHEFPAVPVGESVSIATDVTLEGPATVTWTLDAPPEDDPELLVAVREDGEGARELLDVTADGRQVSVDTEQFSDWSLWQFSKDMITDLTHETLDSLGLGVMVPVAEPDCDTPDLEGWDLVSPPSDRVRMCVDERDGRLTLVSRNARWGSAEFRWTGPVELIDRDDTHASAGRLGRWAIEQLRRTDTVDAAVIPRGSELSLAFDQLAAGEQTTIASRPSGAAVLVDALEIGAEVVLAILAFGFSPSLSDAEQLLQSAGMAACVTEAFSRMPSDGAVADDLRAAYRLAVDLTTDCLLEEVVEQLGRRFLGVAVATVSIAFSSVSALATSGQGIFDELTGQAIVAVTISRDAADDGWVLRPDGLGPFDFGASASVVIDAALETFGPATSDTGRQQLVEPDHDGAPGWFDPVYCDAADYCDIAWDRPAYRELCIDMLCLITAPDDEFVGWHMRAWTVLDDSWTATEIDAVPDLATSEGIGVGSAYEELEAAYPDVELSSGEGGSIAYDIGWPTPPYDGARPGTGGVTGTTTWGEGGDPQFNLDGSLVQSIAAGDGPEATCC